MKITITDSAYEDFIDIKEHYKLEGVEHIGEKHVDDVFTHIENLSEHPQMGRVVPEYGLPSLRELIHPPYRRCSLYVLVNIFTPPNNHDFASSRCCSHTLNHAK